MVFHADVTPARRCLLPPRPTLAALMLFVASAATAAEPALPPQTRGFRTTRTLRLQSVLGSYGLSHPGGVSVSAFSPDGTRLFSGNGSLRAWGLETADELWVAPAGGVAAVAVTPRDDVLVAAADGTVSLWDGKTGQARWKIHAHDGGASRLALTPDARRAVTGGEDGRLVVWDVAAGRILRALGGKKLPTDWVRAPDWVWISPDGKLGYFGVDEIASYHPAPHLWDLDTGADATDAQRDSVEKALFEAESYREKVVALPPTDGPESRRILRARAYGLSIAPDGRLVAVPAGGAGVRLEIWDLRGNGRRVLAPRGNTDRVTTVDASPDGRSVLSVGSDGSTFVWDVATGKERCGGPGSEEAGVGAASFADEGRAVAAVDGILGQYLSWADACTGGTPPTRGEGHPETLGGTILALSPGGRFAAVSERDGRQLALRRVSRPGVIWRFDPRLEVLALSADGLLLVRDGAGTVQLLGSRGTPLATLPAGGPAKLDVAAVSPGGHRIATAHHDGTIRLWDARSAQEIDRVDLSTSTDWPSGLWLGADGTLLAGTARGVVLRFEPLPRAEKVDGR